jgi:hypothetical protein
MPFWTGWHFKGQIWDTLADWRKTGMDTHSIIAEPLFMDAGNHDFRPVKGSPAIDFVKPRMGFVYDLNGDIRATEDRMSDKKPLLYTAGPYEYVQEKK